MKITPVNIDFSIFSISLQQFLNENHPLLSNDLDFIKTRGDGAAELFEMFRSEGVNIETAIANANEYLFSGLHFSLHNMVKGIIENEFSDVIESEKSWDAALRLIPIYAPFIGKYEYNDDFEDSDDYKQLYTEITGAILIYLNQYGV
ncbi:MAG: DUF1896 family protein [Rikenellaceae bacterium]